eukprot:GHVU01148091.1.p1 GENE.GHVU01148091.1~~GHVU01148091.1.p1  ORF type:complete len:165 (+),score=12.97 GHVU01148091.1:924-1418(+)
MGACGDGKGAVEICIAGVHGPIRIPDRFGVPYELRKRLIHQCGSRMGASKVLEELRADRELGILPATTVPLPTARQVKGLWEWFTSTTRGLPRNALTKAATLDFLNYHKANEVEYPLQDENDIVVLDNRMGTDEGFFFTSRRVRRLRKLEHPTPASRMSFRELA